ncbi:hypothetical protein P2H44_08805 [Albimonas sp. CAU 1670]|uniref:hypothetical protein n=1 Tax=Albimonas sp. CAU 1670 TaxID=3032599 RepID=UPI0023DA1363|nr:hypothetical protein [Albimonas sp. CAU 1670]MDF2232650.1 hypothetical protein [Albimonas sp. CAU 1670]
MVQRRASRGWARGRAAAPLAFAAAALALSGCGLWEDEAAVADAPSAPPQSGAPGVEGPRLNYLPAAGVESLEIGQIYRGRLLTAHGYAPATGWFRATLQPRNGGRPGPDGFLEYDLVGAPPELNGGEPGAPARQPLRADLAIPSSALAGVQGVRVHAGGQAVAMRVSAASPEPSQTTGPRTPAVFTPVAPTRAGGSQPASGGGLSMPRIGG